jgi:hypothetical protein
VGFSRLREQLEDVKMAFPVLFNIALQLFGTLTLLNFLGGVWYVLQPTFSPPPPPPPQSASPLPSPVMIVIINTTTIINTIVIIAISISVLSSSSSSPSTAAAPLHNHESSSMQASGRLRLTPRCVCIRSSTHDVVTHLTCMRG